jgi:O-acetylhomoserine (thiol)-lyase
MSKKKGFTTTTLHSDRLLKPEFGAIHQPVHNAVTWGYDDVQGLVNVFQNKTKGYAYSRQGNPTTTALEHKVSQMEQGIATVSFSTGMAAISSTILALMKASDHIIASSYLFGNTRSVMQTYIDLGLQISFVDTTDIEQVKNAYTENTKMVFVETIANPATQVSDLAAIGDFCAEKKLIYMVDNTMTSPYLFRPAEVKASLVINSLTKYIGGHGNALGGSVTDTGLFDWLGFPNIAPIIREQIRPEMQGITQIRKRGLRDGGGTLSPEAAHSISVGSETLALRLERACNNAAVLAEFLNNHPMVSQVYYPGLKGHPEHDRASALFHRYGGLMSFTLADARTLAIPVAHTIFFELGKERRDEMGIPDSMIRLSVGIEDIEDLLEDFGNAFASFK